MYNYHYGPLNLILTELGRRKRNKETIEHIKAKREPPIAATFVVDDDDFTSLLRFALVPFVGGSCFEIASLHESIGSAQLSALRT